MNTIHRLVLILGCIPIWSQSPPPAAVLLVDTDNVQFYGRDTADFSRLATTAGPTPQVPARNFNLWEGVGDIVAVNGQPAKGVWRVSLAGLTTNTAPQNGAAIADINRGNSVSVSIEILTADGAPVGTIYGYGLNGGLPPPGAVASQSNQNIAVIGGTGAYLGVRGQLGFSNSRPAPAPYRGNASMAEDPGFRKQNGQGQVRRDVVQLIPFAAPNILSILHADFSPVTPANPARGGEQLIVAASGLGPTRPGVDPGDAFPAAPLQEVNSPVEITVDGKPAAIVNKVGWPGERNVYRVDFRVPEGLSGDITLRLSAAWIAGAESKLNVR